LPEAPTLDEQGWRDFEVVVWHGIYVPKGTPREAIDKLNEALRAALKDPTVAARFAELGAQIVPESKQSPAGLARLAQVRDRQVAARDPQGGGLRRLAAWCHPTRGTPRSARACARSARNFPPRTSAPSTSNAGIRKLSSTRSRARAGSRRSFRRSTAARDWG
jgi:hypothetical protein